MPLIEPLRPDEWNAALRFALARVPSAQRPEQVRHSVHLLETGVLDRRGVWVAHAGEAIVGVQVCVPLPGAMALFWLPPRDDDCADQLVHACLAWARSIGCKLAQASVGPDDADFAAPLRRCGFQPTTRMRQLAHDLADASPNILAPLRYETYRPSLLPLFAATLLRTYEGTLDCPELNGKRTIDEILAGHRGQGTFHPEFWWLAYDGNVPVGVVLLVEMPDGTTWELAYLGIVPEFRRRGYGRAMTLHAMHALCSQAATRLLLAVDERNGPARTLYQSLGFVELECNEVLLYFW